MIDFLKYTLAPTLQDDTSSIKGFTPSLMMGNSGMVATTNIYDVHNRDTLKVFKITTDALEPSFQPTLQLDTFDLYLGGDCTRTNPYRNSTKFNKGMGNGVGAPLRGAPVRFQRVHFRGHQPEGTMNEYYAIFLVSDPVPITQYGYSVGVNYKSGCNALTYPTVATNDLQEQTVYNEAAEEYRAGTKWNDLSYISADSIGTPTTAQYSGRLVIGDSLLSQFKSLNNVYDNILDGCLPAASCTDVVGMDKTTGIQFLVYDINHGVVASASMADLYGWFARKLLTDISGIFFLTKAECVEDYDGTNKFIIFSSGHLECNPITNTISLSSETPHECPLCNCTVEGGEGSAFIFKSALSGNSIPPIVQNLIKDGPHELLHHPI